MFLHPGKKLNFMGSEFGQLREWDESREQDWDVLRYPIHDGFYHFFQALNRLYLEHPALWAEDYQGEGFTWLDCTKRDAASMLWSAEAAGSGWRQCSTSPTSARRITN